MGKKTINTLIKSVTALIIAAIGGFAGMKYEKISTQTQIKEVIGDVINVTGENNDITINDIENLMQNYTQLQSDIDSLNQQKDALVEQNTQYYNDLANANKTIEELNSGLNSEIGNLKSQLDSTPVLNYRNLALSIDVDDIPINTNNSMVTIDGRDYFSREILESIVPDEKSITIKDDTIFIGKIIAEKANLFEQWISDKSAYCRMGKTIKDSYGNLYPNCLLLLCSDITFNTQGKYSFLKCDIAMSEKSSNGVLIIEADRNLVYSVELNKLSEPITEIEIPIKNCKLLRFSYNTNAAISENGCIIANATLYNE